MSLDHESRAQGIGGSEIATIAGVNKYGSQVDLWLDKKHGQRKELEGYHTERGNHLEFGLLDWYQQRTRNALEDQGARVICDLENFVHQRHPICRATPDGLLVMDSDIYPEGIETLGGHPSEWADRVVEIKAPSSHTWKDWGQPGTDEIPIYYLPQVTWEMAATGVHRCDVAALVNDDLQIYHVNWSQDLFDKLLHMAEVWWSRYVIGDQEPPPDGSEEYKQYVEEKYPRVVRPDLEQAGAEVEALIEDYATARKDEKEAKARKSETANALRRAIGDRDGVTSPIGKARWYSARGSRVLDRDKLSADGIDIDQYYRPGSEYRKLGVWEKKS